MAYEEALELVPDRVKVVNTLLSTSRKEVWEESILVSPEAFDAGFRTEVSLHVGSGVREESRIKWVLMVLSVIVVVLVACLAATEYFASWLAS
jgi:hypothetical protein